MKVPEKGEDGKNLQSTHDQFSVDVMWYKNSPTWVVKFNSRVFLVDHDKESLERERAQLIQLNEGSVSGVTFHLKRS